MKPNFIRPMGLFLLFPAVAYGWFDAADNTVAETLRLPPYCIAFYKMETGQAAGGESSASVEALGRGTDIRHYCQALIHLNRGENSHGDTRARWIKYALGGFDYVLKSASPNAPLLPEIYFNKGKAYFLSSRGPLAEAELKKAIELKPDYVRAYSALSDYYKGIGDNAKARAIVGNGLKHSPESRALRRRFTELGGILPAVEPSLNAAPTESLVATDKLKDDPSSSQSDPASREPVAPPKIGIPGNPYCRFCPDVDPGGPAQK